jgi:hypothetical protein
MHLFVVTFVIIFMYVYVFAFNLSIIFALRNHTVALVNPLLIAATINRD